MNPKVDFNFSKDQKWLKELEQLRAICLDTGLTEELKWGTPCYTLQNSNIVLIHAFKDYCALLFFKGALMNNDKGLLIQQTKNVQAARQIRFTNVKGIVTQKAILKAYIFEAIEVEKAGLKVSFKEVKAFENPAEFQQELNKNPELKKAFASLTPGRQRAYLLHFSSPKQSRTRESRVLNCIPKILSGKGLTD